MTDIRQWMTDPALLGSTFGDESWAAWRALLAGFDGLPLSESEAAIFRELTQREPPTEPLDEFWPVVGRRGGKSITSGLLAVIPAVTFEPRGRLSAGEVTTVMVIAEDRRQARSVYRYIAGLLHSCQMLKRMIRKERADGIELTNRVVIEVHTASFRAVRGYTLLAAILDEVAFWFSDGANPDAEIISALRPGLGTLGGRLIGLSSPYARRGVLWDTYREHYGKEGPILVAQAPTRVLNATFPQSTINKALSRDEPRARAEYLAEFRTDVETFVPREVIEACVEPGCRELGPISGVSYFAFVDPSGGSHDSMTLAIAHNEDGVGVLDAIRERKPPFSPEAVVKEFSELLRSYRVGSVMGDRYAGEWPRERFREHGIQYRVADNTRSGYYSALLPILNSVKARLLDNDRLVNQLVSLERRVSRGGKDSIDHPPKGHDDVANAVAGALVGVTAWHRIPWGVVGEVEAPELLPPAQRSS